MTEMTPYLPDDEVPPCDLCATPDALIGIVISAVYDGVLFWRCQACGRAQRRTNGPLGERRSDIAQMYVWQINRAVADAQRHGWQSAVLAQEKGA